MRRPYLPRSAAVLIPILILSCAPAPVALVGFDDVAWVAALELDARGELLAATEVRTLEGAVAVFTADDTALTWVGWPADAFAGATPDLSERLVGRQACAPRLPAPLRAASVDAETSARVDPALIPPLSAAWARPLCPPRSTAPWVARADCAAARVEPTFTEVEACELTVQLGDVVPPVRARRDPDGAWCVTALEPSTSCQSTPPVASASAAYTCPTCGVALFQTPERAPLGVVRAALLDVAPFVPDTGLTGAQPQLPPLGAFVGHAYDVVVLGDVVVASTGVGVSTILCSGGEVPGRLHARRLEDLAPLATSTAPSCLTLLATDGVRALGVFVDGPTFGLVHITPELEVTNLGRLDTRTTTRAGEPPLARAACERPIDLLLDGDRIFVVHERLPHCGQAGTTVHVLDRRTYAVRARYDLPLITPWRVVLDGARLLIAQATEPTVYVYAPDSLAPRGRLELLPDLARNDFVLADLVVDGDDVLATTTRNQPAIRRSDGSAAFRERGYFLDAEADPVGLLPRFAEGRGLVVGVQDGDAQRWPARAALYDSATLTVLPGSVPVGWGPTRRVRRDDRGGAVLLLPWEAALVRVTPASP